MKKGTTTLSPPFSNISLLLEEEFRREHAATASRFEEFALGDLADDRDPLLNLLLVREREREAKLVCAFAICVARVTREVINSSFSDLGQHPSSVDRLGEADPNEESAVGIGPRRSWRHVSFERIEHDITPALVNALELLDVIVEVIGNPLRRDVRAKNIGAAVDFQN